LVLWHGASLIAGGLMTTGELTSFLLYSLYVGFAFSGAGNFFQEFMKALGSSQRVFEFLDRVPALQQASGERPTEVRGEIEFRNVSFSYPTHSQQSVLQNFNLKLEPGNALAVVGPSGSGKSTLAALLVRFYAPNEGTILLDGKDIATLDVEYLREKFFGVVPQEITLFSGTIADNIRYGVPGATQEEVEEAAKKANAHSFIMQFQLGYSTPVGQRGATLSGGQKQRIGIARALLKNPRVLLLDEATSALDVESEYLVQQALQRVMVGRTVLVIAHRLSTIKNASSIAVIRNGSIVEQGTYNELVAKEGEFKQLVMKQLYD